MRFKTDPKGESHEHREAKLAVHAALAAAGIACDQEVRLGPLRPDLYVEPPNGSPFGIEIQRSNLSITKISQRTRLYHALGIAVLWLPLKRSWIEHEQYYFPDNWEAWLHAASMDTIYYLIAGTAQIVPVHYEAINFDFTDRWFFSNGRGGYGPFYDRRRQRSVIQINAASPIDILDLHRVDLPWLRWGRFGVPDRAMMLDQQPLWWQSAEPIAPGREPEPVTPDDPGPPRLIQPGLFD